MTISLPGYLKEVENVSWVQEIIMETFDGALELLVPGSVVFGGAVRDGLAGMELVGDLDVAVSMSAIHTLSEKFVKSTRWLPKNGLRRSASTSAAKAAPSGSRDLAISTAPMSEITVFTGMGSKEVQLITSKGHTRDPFQDAVYMARMVDIVCCGVILTADGRVFEAVPGAYQDCLDRVLRLNETSDTIYAGALPARIEKLVGRGWNNTIDIDKALRSIKAAEERAKKRTERQMLSSRRDRATSSLDQLRGMDVREYMFCTISSEPMPTDGGSTIEVKREIIDNTFGGDIERLVKFIEHTAREHKVNVRVIVAPIGTVFFSTISSFRSHVINLKLNEYISEWSAKKKLEPRKMTATRSHLP